MKSLWSVKRVNEKLKILIYKFVRVQNSMLIFVQSGYWLVPISWGVVIVYISPRFGSEYSPDSFAYYLIGTNFVSGFGYASQAIRDFYLPVSPDFFQSSRSFPPLMPILVGIVEKFFRKGITSGLLVNIFVLLALFHIHFLLSKQIAKKFFWVAFLALPIFIINNDSVDSFVAEIVSGRSIPLAALLFTCIALIICSRNLSNRSSFFLGFLMAMLYLTRFDSLVFCLLLTGYLTFEKQTNIRWIAFGLLIGVSPWLFRNAIIFGNPFASDNSITAFSTYPSIAQISWFNENIPLLPDNPNLWATQRISYVIENTKIIIRLFSPFGGFFTIMLSAFGLLSPNTPRNIKMFIVIAWLWLISNLMAVSLTPYHDARYFSLTVFAIGLSALLTVVAQLLNQVGIQNALSNVQITDNSPTQKFQWMIVVISLILSIGIVNYFVKSKIKAGDINALGLHCIYDEFKSEVSKSELVASSNAEHLAYYSKWHTIYLPGNLSEPDEKFISWKTKLNVRYAIIPDGSSIGKHPRVSIKRKACGVLLVDLMDLKND